MHTLTDDDLKQQPQAMLDDAQRGEPSLVTVNGEAVMLTVPLGRSMEPAVLVELAARLFDSDQISLGRAAGIAGLSYSEMIDELGRRNIVVVRYSVEDLKRELDYVSTLAGR